jgi:hypothetical protein
LERSFRTSTLRCCSNLARWTSAAQDRHLGTSSSRCSTSVQLTIVHRCKNCLIGSILSRSKRRSSSLSDNARLWRKKHNRELVTYFLTLAGPDAPSRLQKFKLRAWFKLFSRFSNPKALHATDTLREMYRSLISYPDQELQVASLSYLLAYKSPHLRRHEESCVYSSTKPNGEMS